MEAVGLCHPNPNWQSGRAVRCANTYVTHPGAGECGKGIRVLGKASLRWAWTPLPLPLSSALPHPLGVLCSLLTSAAGFLLAPVEVNVPKLLSTTPSLLRHRPCCQDLNFVEERPQPQGETLPGVSQSPALILPPLSLVIGLEMGMCCSSG